MLSQPMELELGTRTLSTLKARSLFIGLGYTVVKRIGFFIGCTSVAEAAGMGCEPCTECYLKIKVSGHQWGNTPPDMIRLKRLPQL